MFNNDLDEMIGVILPYVGDSAPDNYLICDGSAISRTEYAKLFDVIGTSYGSGDGSLTFNLPDCREVALVGAGENTTSAISTHDVYTLGEFKDDQFQSHTHSDVAKFSNDRYTWQSSGNQATYMGRSGGADGRTGTTTRGKRLGVNFIIKYK